VYVMRISRTPAFMEWMSSFGRSSTKLRMGEMTKPSYTCSACRWAGEESKFSTKILSIMYRPKQENIQAFKQIKCPQCRSLVTIVFETLDASLTL